MGRDSEHETLNNRLHDVDAAAEFRRDRLLAGLTLICGVGLFLALPFALRAGAEFFLPVTAALIIAIALVPMLEWLERRHLPSSLAALLCVLIFLIIINVVLVIIIVPAAEWFRVLPERIETIQSNLSVVIDIYSSMQKFIERTLAMVAAAPKGGADAAAATPPSSLLGFIAAAAPQVLIQVFFAILVVFFFLSGWTRVRRNTIQQRETFGGAMAIARVIQNVVDATSAYLGTITLINILLGAMVAGVMWMMGMPTPLMWGGIVALMNFVPYLGPIAAMVLLTLGGLMTFDDIWTALIPAGVFITLHMIEANLITPLIVGRRLTINPLLILLSLSYFAWIWGALGALLAVPILIIVKTVAEAAGKPDIAGFLFEEGTLTHMAHHPDDDDD